MTLLRQQRGREQRKRSPARAVGWFAVTERRTRRVWLPAKGASTWKGQDGVTTITRRRAGRG